MSDKPAIRLSIGASEMAYTVRDPELYACMPETPPDGPFNLYAPDTVDDGRIEMSEFSKGFAMGWREHADEHAPALTAANARADAAEARAARMEGENAQMRGLLVEAAADLTAYVNTEYPPDRCEKYPDIARRHHRDLELVRSICAALTPPDTVAPPAPRDDRPTNPEDGGCGA